jgi:hypothetical protein
MIEGDIQNLGCGIRRANQGIPRMVEIIVSGPTFWGGHGA